ncbi:MAG TPA: DNA translocase FtsK 4TM domain-containing protein, partial [Elusimicrobiota bacterium]|nr:DNA translocase FtsK 4TM domain-containing protein [Elusimicrobiota bacterium]
MPTHRYKAAAKSAKGGKSRKDILPSALRWAAFFLGAVYLGWALLFPSMSGDWGRTLADALHGALGGSALLLPLFLFNWLLRRALRAKSGGSLTTAIASLFGLVAGTILCAEVGSWFDAGAAAAAGGSLGAAAAGAMARSMGHAGAFLVP